MPRIYEEMKGGKKRLKMLTDTCRLNGFYISVFAVEQTLEIRGLNVIKGNKTNAFLV